ncbi:MAG: NAD(P)/FAD-dependent oxidoreductase [Chloroflexi bacterium]|nr:NAD(P)/FAD-dependent oxidoreductase [Chloroflexota bacterium]
MRYDAIVAGASFAGLAVAAQLRGRVLLLDRKQPGTGQTSACGTLLAVAEHLGVMDSVLQVHNHFEIWVGHRLVRYNLLYPFCTFDYTRLCESLLERTDADVLTARVKGMKEQGVETDRGYFESDLIVDATGWRATLARSLSDDYVDRRRMCFGLETVAPHRAEGLHFWANRTLLPDGVTWVFPCGDFSRVGIASYAGRTDLKAALVKFLGSLGLSSADSLHGGFFPWALRQPVVENIFVVGDAAGQCFGLSGEGIRPSLYFGQACGRAMQKVIDGDLSLAAGQAEYSAFVKSHGIYFEAMGALQRLFPHLSELGLYLAGGFIGIRPVLSFLMREYWKGSDPALFSSSKPQRAAHHA